MSPETVGPETCTRCGQRISSGLYVEEIGHHPSGASTYKHWRDPRSGACLDSWERLGDPKRLPATDQGASHSSITPPLWSGTAAGSSRA